MGIGALDGGKRIFMHDLGTFFGSLLDLQPLYWAEWGEQSGFGV